MSSMLIVIDMQNDFVDGALGTKEAQEIAPRVIEKIKNYKGQVLYTRDTHEEDYLETLEGKSLPGAALHSRHKGLGTDSGNW